MLKCNNVQKGRVTAVPVTRGDQQELARQKNKKGRAARGRESTELPGRLSPKQRDTQIMQQKLRKAEGKGEAK